MSRVIQPNRVIARQRNRRLRLLLLPQEDFLTFNPSPAFNLQNASVEKFVDQADVDVVNNGQLGDGSQATYFQYGDAFNAIATTIAFLQDDGTDEDQVVQFEPNTGIASGVKPGVRLTFEYEELGTQSGSVLRLNCNMYQFQPAAQTKTFFDFSVTSTDLDYLGPNITDHSNKSGVQTVVLEPDLHTDFTDVTDWSNTNGSKIGLACYYINNDGASNTDGTNIRLYNATIEILA